MLSLNSLKAADAAANGTTHSPRILFLHIKSCILHCFPCSCNRILAKQLHASCCLFVHVLLGVEVLHLSGQLTLILCSIKLGDRCKADFFLPDTAPKLFHTVADGSDCSHSGYYNSSHIAIPPSTQIT